MPHPTRAKERREVQPSYTPARSPGTQTQRGKDTMTGILQDSLRPFHVTPRFTGVPSLGMAVERCREAKKRLSP